MHALSLLKKRLKKEKLDALFVSKPVNVSYLSGFTGCDAYLLVTKAKDFFITDFRYKEQAKKEIKGFEIEIVGANNHSPLLNHFDLIIHLIQKNNLKRIGFEAKHISYGEVSKFRDKLVKQEFLPTYDFTEDLRIIKSALEIKIIKKAVKTALEVFYDIRCKIKPGARERDLAAFIEYQLRLRGAEGASFDTIVLSGKNSVLPHGQPSYRQIKQIDAVLVDMGAVLQGYNSDLTRMFFLGKIPDTARKIYDVVKKAQAMAIKAIKPDVKACVVDAVARDYIKSHGWCDYFGHSLGHGIGREVHEAPSLSPRSKTILKPGMVLTVEPAVYMPGVGGIRLEEMVVVTEKGAEVLSQ